MKLAEHFQLARDAYVGFYREKLRELKQAHSDCVAELLVLPNGAQNPEPYSLIRIDALYGPKESPNVFRFALPLALSRDLSEAEHDEMRVTVASLSWEHLTFTFQAAGFQLAGLREWLSRWIDDKEVRQVDDLGLAGVLHAIAWDSSDTGKWTITVDFGTAPISCALELLQELQRQGVASCVLTTEEEEA